MDVIFEISKEKCFVIEIGYFDTVLEIKQKIHKYQKIDVESQTLIFKGEVMADDRDTEFYSVLHKSRIQLVVKPKSEKSKANGEEAATPPSTSKLQLVIKIPMCKRQFSLEVDANDTIGKLRERIHEVEALPMSRFIVCFNGNELSDNRSIGDYSIPNYAEVSAILRPFPPSSPSASSHATNPKKLKLMVLLKSGEKKIQLEVNASDNVGDLRKELQRLQQQMNFQLPTEGYFFIYKQNVMDDDRSFRWHDVKQGDTIEIFSGSVTGGS